MLKVDKLSKQYRLGQFGTGTISHDLNRFIARLRGKPDPYLKIGDVNDRSTKGNSNYVWALKDINFKVEKGEVLGIIGKNGAGKSTLLKILSRVTSPSEGSIKTKGRIASLLEVGTGFHPEMTGKENIFLNGAILGMTKKETASKLDEIVAFSGCERYIDTPVKRYSSGMKVRLAFAVAAFLEPDILIVDEVLAVGDAEFQKKAIGKMQDISKESGRTVLFVSHDMMAIQNLCNRVIILENGLITYDGDVISGINKYLMDDASKGNLDLLESRSRSGSGITKFKSVTFTSLVEDKEIVDPRLMYSSSKVYIDIELQNYVKFEKRGVKVSLEVMDTNNVPILNFSNEFTKNNLFLEGDITKIRFEIESLNLIANDYILSLWGADESGCFDYLVGEVVFSVIATDFFNTGVLPKRRQHGFMLVNNKSYNI